MPETNGNGHNTTALAGADAALVQNVASEVGLNYNECELIYNYYTRRMDFLKHFSDPRRDVFKECGLPDVNSLDARYFRDLHLKDGIAARVNEVYAMESWKRTPTVYEDEDADTITEFEEAWDALSKQLRGESLREEEIGSAVWDYLLRLDVMAGIGHFGVLLLGLNDGKPLSEPCDGIDRYGLRTKARPKDRKLLFLRVFDESLVNITKWENDGNSPRFDQPTEYSITLNDPSSMRNGLGVDTKSQNVHWSRVIHVADQLMSNEVIAEPRCKGVLPWILNLQKLYHGSAEGYWQGCFPSLAIETHPQLGGDATMDLAKVRRALNRFRNSSQKDLLLEGMHANSIAPSSSDPTAQIEAVIQAICIRIACPKRVFEGSERGELASSQDDDSWNERLIFRQAHLITPRIISPFVDRCIALGVLPMPQQYHIWWPDLKTMGAKEKADVGLVNTQALVAYVGGGVDVLVPPLDYLTRIQGMEEEDAHAILENAKDHIEEARPDTEEDVVPGREPTEPTDPLDAEAKAAQVEATKAKAQADLAKAKQKPVAANVENFNPSQPRVPAGNPNGGEWVGKFSRFKSYQEAEQHIISKGLANEALLTGLSPSEASAVVLGLEKSLSAAGHNLRLRSIKVESTPGETPFHNADYSAAGHIRIDPTFTDYARAVTPETRQAKLSYYESLGGKRNYVKDESASPEEAFLFLTAHEAGHHVENALMLDLGKAWRDNDGRDLSESNRMRLSGYATTNNQELFAEAHAAMSLGRADLVPPDLQSWYKSALGTADPDPVKVFVRNEGHENVDPYWAEVLANAKGGPNCGTGAGGFKPSNKCALGGKKGVRAFQERRVAVAPPPVPTQATTKQKTAKPKPTKEEKAAKKKEAERQKKEQADKARKEREEAARKKYEEEEQAAKRKEQEDRDRLAAGKLTPDEMSEKTSILLAAEMGTNKYMRQNVENLNATMQKHDASLEGMRQSVVHPTLLGMRAEAKAKRAEADKLEQEAAAHWKQSWGVAKGDLDASRAYDEKHVLPLRADAKVLRATADGLEQGVRKQAHAELAAELDRQGIERISSVYSVVRRAPEGTSARNKLEEAKPFLEQVVGKSLNNLRVDAEDIDAGAKQRSHCSVAGKNVSTIRMGAGAGADVFVHEFGHSIEAHPKALDAANAFLAKRTNGEGFVALRKQFPDVGFDVGEVGAEDEFGKALGQGSHRAHYAGKYYRGKYTEITSMGLEKLYVDPVGFAESDPEYFKFTVGIASGRLLE